MTGWCCTCMQLAASYGSVPLCNLCSSVQPAPVPPTPPARTVKAARQQLCVAVSCIQPEPDEHTCGKEVEGRLQYAVMLDKLACTVTARKSNSPHLAGKQAWLLCHCQQATVLFHSAHRPSLTIAIAAPHAALAARRQQRRPVSGADVIAVINKVQRPSLGAQPQDGRGGSDLWSAHEILQILSNCGCCTARVRLQMEGNRHACPLRCC